MKLCTGERDDIGTTTVEIDYGSSEFQVGLKGVNHDLSKSDFIL